MPHLEFKIPVKGIGDTFISGKSFKSDRMNEIVGLRRHQHIDIRVLLYQQAGKSRRFIGGYTGRHPQNNGFSFQHILHSLCP